jgi:hypothetical protein
VPPQPPDSQRRPDVLLDVVFEDGLLYLALSNIGDAPAVGVSFELEPRLRGLGGTRDVAELALLRNVEFLAPGREIRTLLDSSAAYFGRGEPTKLVAKGSYRDASGRPYETTIHHDLAIYRELAYVPSTRQREVQRDA